MESMENMEMEENMETTGAGEEVLVTGASSIPDVPVDEMTSMDFYLDSYAQIGVHEELLKDEIRTLTFRNAIYYNKLLFKGKVILDVGCGTGILSLFAAKAGAAKVIGIECSNIAEHARTIVAANGFEDIITIIKGKVEEVELPDGIEAVDVIISDWMGSCLFHESMLQTVLYARDKWLKWDGLMFPDKCSLFVAGIEDRDLKDRSIQWWNGVMKFNMSCLRGVALQEPRVIRVDPASVMTDACRLLEIDLYTVSKPDLNFEVPFNLIVNRNDYVFGLMTFFKVQFTKCLKTTAFSTAPEAEYTHWKQTVFFLNDYITAHTGEEIRGRFGLKQNTKNTPMGLEFQIMIDFDGEHCQLKEDNKYRMPIR